MCFDMETKGKKTWEYVWHWNKGRDKMEANPNPKPNPTQMEDHSLIP